MATNRFEDWGTQYASRMMSAEAAARLVRDGDTVVIPIGVVAPAMTKALFERKEEFQRVDIITTAPLDDPGWFEPGHAAFQVHVEIFNTVVGRQSLLERRSDFISMPFSRRFKGEDERGEHLHSADVCFLSVSAPDRFGNCSFGTSVWNKKSFAKRARTVIAEVFPGLPRTGGDNFIHVSEIDAFVEGGTPATAPSQKRGEFPKAIAQYVNELIQDGDTFQIGAGGTTTQLVVQGAFEGKEDLGVHSEISVPGMNDLVYQGIVTGARKSLHPGKFVTTHVVASTPEELEFINENPVYELYEVNYTNDIQVIAANDNMVAINNALAVDFTGQISAESMGHDMWSGPGGQPEFAIGALLSKGGRSITVLPASAKGGTVSRIMPAFEPGTVVTVPRMFADIVVTEHGIARLFGKTDRERAEELISVAHPDHRADLRKQAKKLLGL